MSAPDDVALVGFAEPSAPVVHARLLAGHDRFGKSENPAAAPPGLVRPDRRLRRPGPGCRGRGRRLPARRGHRDRLAYLRLLAVRDDRGRTGLGRRLVAWFDDVARDTGARVVQAVAWPEDTAAVAPHTALGASRHLVRDRSAPGEDRIVLTPPPRLTERLCG